MRDRRMRTWLRDYAIYICIENGDSKKNVAREFGLNAVYVHHVYKITKQKIEMRKEWQRRKTQLQTL